MFNVTQAARHAKVSGTTIRNWSADYADYLSPAANPQVGQARQFTEEDLQVFATVAVMRAQLVEPEAIRAALDAGQRLEPIRPPEEEKPAADQDQADQSAAAASTALTLYSQQVNALQARADQLADRLIESERRIADERAARAAAERELAILREMYEAATSPAPADRRPTFWQWFTGRK